MNCKKCGAELNEEDYVFMGYCEKCYEIYVDSDVSHFNNPDTFDKINSSTTTRQEKKQLKRFVHYGLIEEETDSTNMKYEYLVKSFTDEDSGDTDPYILERIINNCARQGWRLKHIYTNELGKNSVGVGIGGIGSQTNATIERTFLIFEREVNKNDL